MDRLRRSVFALLLAALVLAPAGCSIVEEIDSAAAMMEPQKAKAKSAQDEAAQARGDAKRQRPLQWDEVKTIHTGELDGSIVRCELNGSTQFMRADDCRSRGGRVGEV